MEMPFSRSSLLSQAAAYLIFITVHLSATLLAPYYFSSAGLVTLFWPATGIALAAVLAGGYGYAWATLASCTLAAVLDPGKGWAQIFFTAANVLEIFLARLVILRLARVDIAFDKSHDYIRFILFAGILLPVPAALVAATTLQFVAQSPSPFWFNAQEWWMSDSLGILSLTPLLLIWRRLPRGWFFRERLIEAIVGLALTVLASYLFLGTPGESAASYPRAFLFFIFVAWAATRFGRHATLLVTSIVIAFALAGSTANGKTPDGQAINFANIWLFMVTLSTVGMALATVFNERRAALLKNAQLLEAYRTEEMRRTASDQAARKSAIDFERLVETASEGVWTIDSTGITTFVNGRMAEMLGCSPKDMLGKSFFDFMRQSEFDFGRRQLERRKAGIAEGHEGILLHQDGHAIEVWMSTSPITDIEGNVTGALALVTDMSSRKEIESRLRECEERYDKVINRVSDAVLIHQSGIILFANPAAAELLGEKNAASLVGMNSLNFAHPDEQPVIIERMKQLLQNDKGEFLPPSGNAWF
ncbi:MAG: PAS domain S-box protein [Spirochaetota bacterium]